MSMISPFLVCIVYSSMVLTTLDVILSAEAAASRPMLTFNPLWCCVSSFILLSDVLRTSTHVRMSENPLHTVMYQLWRISMTDELSTLLSMLSFLMCAWVNVGIHV